MIKIYSKIRQIASQTEITCTWVQMTKVQRNKRAKLSDSGPPMKRQKRCDPLKCPCHFPLKTLTRRVSKSGNQSLEAALAVQDVVLVSSSQEEKMRANSFLLANLNSEALDSNIDNKKKTL